MCYYTGTMHRLLKLYLQHLESTGTPIHVIWDHRDGVRNFARWHDLTFGAPCAADKLDASIVSEYDQYLAGTALSQRKCHIQRNVLKRFFAWAHKCSFLRVDPWQAAVPESSGMK